MWIQGPDDRQARSVSRSMWPALRRIRDTNFLATAELLAEWLCRELKGLRVAFVELARKSEVAERMSCHNAKHTGSASRRCCLSLKGARLKGFRRNLFDVCYVFSNMFRSFSYPPVLVGWRHSVPANCSSNECWKIFHRKFFKLSQADFFLCDCGGCYKK
ncbi:uncharacterized protein LOC26536149 [Drosophila yakuba]|uniref:Uncharacterized protein n=1 Tax=Drosophila yakuba TaxID=7245 RepID=A0A0R1DW03_DROYA|nr:uncharacterized protein LOC26536149 [Drosophila yakuba]KRJ98966.1 uncharacterized protein Dyak_GE28968 [Drosophila yakuba]